MNIKLYTTHCPKCKVIEKKLIEKGVEFELIDNVDEVLRFGQDHNINMSPILVVDDEILSFGSAVTYLNNL